jgi:carbon-monoxide dehydrogenase medium subunit/xanthine dehydrogenase FAD-binding subunit
VNPLIHEVYQTHHIAEALELLKKFGERAKLIAGGPDLIIQLREGRVSPVVLIDISSVEETREINEVEQMIEIGSTVTFTQVETHPLFSRELKAIAQAARSIGSPQIRNRATVGGNICNASPAADMLPPLLALDALAVLKRDGHTRMIPLSDFITGKEQTALETDELLDRIRFRKIPDKSGLGFSKLGVRNALAIARLSMALYVAWDQEDCCCDIRIASGALGVKAQREWEIESFMAGKKLNDTLIDETAAFLEENTVKRLAGRSTLPFKRHAVQGVFREAFDQAVRGPDRRKKNATDNL